MRGTLVYRGSGVVESRQISWFDRTGKSLGSATAPGFYSDVALAPDGKRAAVAQTVSGNWDIWTIELGKNLVTRFTFDKAQDRFPVWSPDGSRIVFSSNRDGGPNLHVKDANGATSEEVLAEIERT